MSFIECCDEEVTCEWNTNQFFIIENKKEETLKWLKALEIVFNADGFSFGFNLDSYNRLKIWGEGYEFRISEEIYDSENDDEVKEDDIEILEELFDRDYDDIKSEYPEIIDSVEEIVHTIIHNCDETQYIADFIKSPKMNINYEETKRSTGEIPKCYISNKLHGIWDVEL